MSEAEDDRKRLDEIVKTFVECGHPFGAFDVAKQFKFETKHVPDVDQLARAMMKAARKS